MLHYNIVSFLMTGAQIFFDSTLANLDGLLLACYQVCVGLCMEPNHVFIIVQVLAYKFDKLL